MFRPLVQRLASVVEATARAMSMKDPVSRPRKVALLAAFAIILSIAYLTVWSFVAATQLDQANALRVGEGIAQELADKTRVTISHTDRLTKLAQAVSQGTNTSIFSSPDLVADSSAQVILADAMGTVLESTVLRPGQTIAATQFFRDTHETWSSELYLGAPEPLTAGGPKILPMVKRLFQANGQYAGFVTVVYPAESLTNTLTLPGFPTTLFAVVNSKGDVLSRSLGDVTTVGGSLTPAERHALEGGVLKTQPLVSFPSLGRADLLTVAVPVGRQGLIAVVGIPLDEATAETKKLFWAVFPVAALICLGVAATAGLILRQTKRLHQSVASLKATETVLREDRTFLSVTLASVEEGVLTVDAEGRITYMNRRATLLTGWDSQSAGGRAFTEVVHLWPDADDSSPISRLEDLQGHSSYLLRDVDGNIYSVECAVNELSEGSDNGNRVVVLHDVSKAAQMARTLHHQATHDALTGLLNRNALHERLDAALANASRDKTVHSLLFMDLDQFKVVNDTCGHVAGDELLKQVTFLLQQCLRKGDTLARMGGDEFAVLLEDCDGTDALAIAEKLRATVCQFRFTWLDKSFGIGVSIGLVPVTANTLSRADIMRKADTACYIAKDSGRNRVHFYYDGDTAVMERQGELDWASKLQKALAHGQLTLLGQRIRSLQGDDACDYFEMLVRLVNEDGTLVPPMAFMPAAERYGLMPALDRAVIERAFALLREVQVKATRPVRFAINLSGASLSDPTLAEFIETGLRRHTIDPCSVCFEVTETVAIANLQVAVTLMRQLKALGCALALDDFGSGMSSFSYLKQLPVDIVKIDGSFVRHMLENPVDQAMVQAISSVSQTMGLKTLAEYVETPELANALRELGVDMVQGYGVGKPEKLEALYGLEAAIPQPA